MKYTFDASMHIGLTYTVDAKSFDEAVAKSRALKDGCCYWEFPDVCIGDTDMHLCYVEETDDDDVSYVKFGNIDEWI